MQLALEKYTDTRKRYQEICQSLLKYQEEYPFYFKLVLETINIDFETTNFLPEEKETFMIGEQINALLADFFKEGIASGQIRSDIEMVPTIFAFWGMISGLIQLVANKEDYIGQQIGMKKEDFLAYGFDTLYRAIAVGEEK